MFLIWQRLARGRLVRQRRAGEEEHHEGGCPAAEQLWPASGIGYTLHMGMVKGITFYSGPPLRHGVEPARGLMLDDDGALCRTFRKALLESQLEFRMDITLPDARPLTCHWGRCGQTAGVVAWYRNQVVEAVTVYLSGIDREEEAAAAEGLLASRPFPIPLYRWHEVLKSEHPLYATFLFTPASVEDVGIPTAAPALANSFFTILGVIE
jgi:hypothetical protein